MDSRLRHYRSVCGAGFIALFVLSFHQGFAAGSKNVKRDTNKDGQIDQIAHFDSTHTLTLLEIDSNLDGKMDRYQYYKNGAIERLEADLDGDDTIDTTDFFQDKKRIRHLRYFPEGKKVMKIIDFDGEQLPVIMRRDTTADGHFDTVYNFIAGNLTESTRDINGNNLPNIWTTYSNNLPTLQKSDRNGNSALESLMYFDDRGQAQKSLHDIDEDGFYEEVRLYTEGRLHKQQKDLDKNGRFEIETYYADDVPTKQKKDSNNDSVWDIETRFKNGHLWKQKKDSDYDFNFDWFCSFGPDGHIEKIEQDTNKNSTIDTLRLFVNGEPDKILYDTNEDKYYEIVTILQDGLPATQTQDTNNDKKMDITIVFDKNGDKSKTSIDSNFNDREDIWEYYEKGILFRVDQDPRESGWVLLRSIYENNAKVRLEQDRDGDGRFEMVEKFNSEHWSSIIEWDEDGDNNPEQRICSLDGVIRLKESDANSDGQVDLREEYNSESTIIRLSEDIDNSGILNLVWKYNKKGEPVAAEKDSDGDNKTDIWYFYRNGRITDVQEDLNRDGAADLWEYYDISETLVKRAKDLNYDGQPDIVEEL